MFDIPVILTIIVVTAIILFTVRMWLKQIESKTQMSGELVEWLKDVSKRMDHSSMAVDEKLSRNMEIFNKRLDSTAAVIGDVQKSIGEFAEMGKSMKQLQEFLQSPKLRGNIGEQVLKQLLAQSLPADLYALQYTFKTGEKVDAVIKTENGLIPIDSKFPMENFQKMARSENKADHGIHQKEFIRDIKKHISDISRKYILVGEGTIDYALMYIPSESVYYELINTGDMYDYCVNLRVVPVSPLSFYAYLKSILISFEGQRIQSQAKEILKHLQGVRKDFEKADESFGILNKHINNAFSQSQQLSRNFLSLEQKINSTKTLSSTPTTSSVEQEPLLE